MAKRHPSRDEFLSFAREVEPRLRFALVAACGPQRGVEAATDALAFAWEPRDRVGGVANPAGYLYGWPNVGHGGPAGTLRWLAMCPSQIRPGWSRASMGRWTICRRCSGRRWC